MSAEQTHTPMLSPCVTRLGVLNVVMPPRQVTALGLANAFGRLGAGWISDRVVGAGLPRALLFCGMLLVTCVVDFLLAAG